MMASRSAIDFVGDMMTKCAETAMADAGVRSPDISRFVPHQANARIIDFVGDSLGAAHRRFVRAIAEYGNSSAVTIPLSLPIAIHADPFLPGEKLLLTAAGAGLTRGAIVWGI